MSDTVGVDVARYEDRDVVAKALEERGYTATPIEEDGGRLGFDIVCDDASGRSYDEMLHELELLVGELEVPLVPIRGEGVVFLRPPGD